jgi:hypothetical protein
MALDLPPPQVGQFDDPIEVNPQENYLPRLDNGTIDNHLLDSSESDDLFSSDEENEYSYEPAVDDEDWDIAERGIPLLLFI